MDNFDWTVQTVFKKNSPARTFVETQSKTTLNGQTRHDGLEGTDMTSQICKNSEDKMVLNGQPKQDSFERIAAL
jgi:hypothetical protein